MPWFDEAIKKIADRDKLKIEVAKLLSNKGDSKDEKKRMDMCALINKAEKDIDAAVAKILPARKADAEEMVKIKKTLGCK